MSVLQRKIQNGNSKGSIQAKSPTSSAQSDRAHASLGKSDQGESYKANTLSGGSPGPGASPSQTETQMTKPIPTVYSRYEGEGLHLYWINPWSGKEEMIACFYWPAHPMEDTKQVEDWFEAIAERACSEVTRPAVYPGADITTISSHSGAEVNWRARAEAAEMDAAELRKGWAESQTPKETSDG